MLMLTSMVSQRVALVDPHPESCLWLTRLLKSKYKKLCNLCNQMYGNCVDMIVSAASFAICISKSKCLIIFFIWKVRADTHHQNSLPGAKNHSDIFSNLPGIIFSNFKAHLQELKFQVSKI